MFPPVQGPVSGPVLLGERERGAENDRARRHDTVDTCAPDDAADVLQRRTDPLGLGARR